MSVEVDVWYVKLADGDVDRVTLDELDAAFQSGHIDENSMVLAAGTDQWMKLGELLGATDATPPPPPPTPTPETSAQPLAPPALAVQSVPQSVAQPPAMVRPASPMQAQVQPVLTVAPPPNLPVANTLRPMSFDLEADDVQFPRGRSGKGKLVAVLAVAVLGAAAFVVVKRGVLSAPADTSAPTFAAAAQPAAPPSPPPETAAPTPPMQASLAGPSSVMDPTRADTTQHLSDAQKQRLLEADKKVKTHEHSHGGGGAVSHASTPKSKSSSGAFTTSGNKYDPLNSSL